MASTFRRTMRVGKLRKNTPENAALVIPTRARTRIQFRCIAVAGIVPTMLGKAWQDPIGMCMRVSISSKDYLQRWILTFSTRLCSCHPLGRLIAAGIASTIYKHLPEAPFRRKKPAKMWPRNSWLRADSVIRVRVVPRVESCQLENVALFLK